MRSWFRAYLGSLTGRVNSLTGAAYRDDPSIMAWELANEPRSSDPTGGTVATWAAIEAKPEDFRRTTQRVYRTPEHPSYVELTVLP